MGRAARQLQGQWHTIEDAGINPLPTRRKIPLWFGGHEDATLRRIAKWGDGWIMLAHPAGRRRQCANSTSCAATSRTAGRDPTRGRPGGVGVDRRRRSRTIGASNSRPGRTRASRTSPSTAAYNRGPHKRIAGKTVSDSHGGHEAVPRGRRRPALTMAGGADVLFNIYKVHVRLFALQTTCICRYMARMESKMRARRSPRHLGCTCMRLRKAITAACPRSTITASRRLG